ncbi:probable G-protein coupled receptor 148 [Vombatus ursinus]|uniref:G-protein coupled receptors family 1 profile domain-containing protein n=1 Tax=Vombatus ursinus TaxID=29139 RepID=A0A4X2L3L8_VOMUR|nr:probable G-protein coupled receptor 148 [Vombatus ursinus]
MLKKVENLMLCSFLPCGCMDLSPRNMAEETVPSHLWGKATTFQVEVVNLAPAFYQLPGNYSVELEEAFWALLPSLRWFFIPLTLLTTATLALNPLLLATILWKKKFRSEPRYVLFANVMFSDLAYLLFHVLVSTSNLTGWTLGRIFCGILTDALFISYASTILSFTVMVADTYLAVMLPLRYLSLMSSATARKVVAIIWVVACFFPTFLVWFSKRQDSSLTDEPSPCILQLNLSSNSDSNHLITVAHIFIFCALFVCAALISYCYVKIYHTARTSGLCIKRYSRAKGTLLIHTMLIVLYISPVVVFAVDIMLSKSHPIGNNSRLWLMAINSEILMLLPRALLPYLYGLRYRQLLQTLKGLVSRRRTSDIQTISLS